MNDTNLTGSSQDTLKELKSRLYTLMPEVFTEGSHGKIDWEKLKVTLGEDITFSNERYVLNWAGKSDAFRSLQTPTTKTLIPAKEESIHFDTTQNIFIEGENLDVLKVLQKSYHNQIKMIYIDPPYNTGNDSFIYSDKFSETKDAYLRRIGAKDEEGYATKEGQFHKNSKENGQYHSNWLNMMYPRLFLARNLLKEDGVIFVSIDDNEVHNLRLIMNEIFGEENFVAEYVWKARSGRDHTALNVSVSHEYILCFSKNLETTNLKRDVRAQSGGNYSDCKGSYKRERLRQWGTNDRRIDRPTMYYPIKTPEGNIVYPIKNDGSEGCWRISESRMKQMLSKNEVDFVHENGVYHLYAKKYDGNITSTAFGTILDDTGTSSTGTLELKGFFSTKVFDTTKPSTLISKLMKVSIDSNDVVLDFFAGSATTAHAVLDLNREDGGNRKFICVQLPETCDMKSEAYKAGYQTIADIAKERIRRVIKKINDAQNGKMDFGDTKQDLGFKVFKLRESNFKKWQPQPQSNEDLLQELAFSVDSVKGEPTHDDILVELILKSGFCLTSPIEKRDGFYLVNDGELIIVLDPASEVVFYQILALKPQIVIALDTVFKNNNPLKTNITLQFKDACITFKVV